MERKLTITSELLYNLVESRGRLVRDDQKFAWEDAYELAVGIGKFIMHDFTIDKENAFAYENVAKWLVGDPSMKCHSWEGKNIIEGDLQKGLYIQGPTGTGKSVLLEIYNRVASYLKIQVKDTYSPIPIKWKTCTADSICDKYEKEGDLTPYKSTPVLCIQDMGTEPYEVVYMGTRRGCIRLIIEARGDMYDKMTLISSNIPVSKIADHYGERVSSRLAQMCNIITIDGKDRRRK